MLPASVNSLATVKNKSLKFELPSINLDSLIAEINAILSEDLSQITSTEKEKKAFAYGIEALLEAREESL